MSCIQLSFKYKHVDGEVTGLTRQLSVQPPSNNESENMTHSENGFKGCWCVVRAAQIQFDASCVQFIISNFDAMRILC